jgi:hypothetical protein
VKAVEKAVQKAVQKAGEAVIADHRAHRNINANMQTLQFNVLWLVFPLLCAKRGRRTNKKLYVNSGWSQINSHT